MARMSLSAMPVAKVYPAYVRKAERKGRTQGEVDEIICWLTGYSSVELQGQIDAGSDFATFFAMAPRLNPNAPQITGVICGVRVENIADPVEQNVRRLDKLIDELAKGRAMERILRA
jgi:hypothetical protein